MKEAADGSRMIYVQSFSGRGPVEGVEISVLSMNGTVLKNATTDAIGRAELPSLRGLQREKAPVALVAKKGDDLAFIPWAKSERHLDTSRFDVGGVVLQREVRADGLALHGARDLSSRASRSTSAASSASATGRAI